MNYHSHSTNPVTGWKGLYVNKSFTKRINELTKDESENMLNYLFRHIAENFNFQVRFRWEQDDLAIWDNRSTNVSSPPLIKASLSPVKRANFDGAIPFVSTLAYSTSALPSGLQIDAVRLEKNHISTRKAKVEKQISRVQPPRLADFESISPIQSDGAKK